MRRQRRRPPGAGADPARPAAGVAPTPSRASHRADRRGRGISGRGRAPRRCSSLVPEPESGPSSTTTRRRSSTSPSRRDAVTRCPTRGSCAAPKAGDARHASGRARARGSVQALALRGRRHGRRRDRRPARDALRAAARAGTKVSKVAGLKDDLSYALATTEIRILAPIPGKQAVGVEVPNHSPNLVTLGDIFDDLPATASPLSVWLGKDISGNAIWTDLARMPHVLIAGTTGSGKSGCINTILTSILLRATPDDVRMILIDPKRIELNYYESIPHLLTPVVSTEAGGRRARNVVGEMERRYEQMSTSGRAACPR